jgi:polyhydroxyalkanoate synthesis regulator phasin
MGKRFSTATLTVGIAAGALAGIAVGAPLLASAAGTDTPTPSASSPSQPGTLPNRPDRQAEIKAALKALVDDGTITQAQADKVAARLDQALPKRGLGRDGDGVGGGKHGMHGLVRGGLDAAAKALGMTSDQVRQGLESGKSLADLAKEKGVTTAKLVDALVAEANTRIDQAVKDGNLTADRAASIKSRLKERITSMIDVAPPAFGRGGPMGGPHGDGFGGFGGPGASQTGPSQTGPSQTGSSA